MRFVSWPTLLMLLAGLAGCGSGDTGLPPLHPVAGVVTRGKMPVPDALVRLESQPANTILTITAATDTQGRFELSTFSAKANIRQTGAPEGTYRVTVTLPVHPDQSGGGVTTLPQPFRVKPGANALDIEVGKPQP
jgi:hypothetical protein